MGRGERLSPSDKNRNKPVVTSEIYGPDGLGVQVICENGSILALDEQEAIHTEENAKGKCAQTVENPQDMVQLSNLEKLHIFSEDGLTAYIAATCKNKEDVVINLVPEAGAQPVQGQTQRRVLNRAITNAADEYCALMHGPGSIPNKRQNKYMEH